MVTVTNIEKHSAGDLIMVTADLASVANGNTWTVPHINKIVGAPVITCTTDATISATTATNVVTFVDGATLAGSITVFGTGQ